MPNELMSRVASLAAAAIVAVGGTTAEPASALSLEAPRQGSVRDAHTEVELITEHAAVIPGKPITLGIRIKPDDGWHTYWINAGGSGAPTTFEWQLPEGFEPREPRWPAPERHEYFGITNYGYEREFVVPVTIDVPERLDDPPTTDRVSFVVRVDWLTCEEVCIPGSAMLRLDVPVSDADESEPTAQWAELFERAYNELPAEPTATVHAYRNNNRSYLRFEPPPTDASDANDADDAGEPAAVTDAYFFHADTGLIDYDADQPLTIDGEHHTLALPLARRNMAADEWPDRLRGVLMFKYGTRSIAWQIDAPLRTSNPTVPPSQKDPAR